MITVTGTGPDVVKFWLLFMTICILCVALGFTLGRDFPRSEKK